MRRAAVAGGWAYVAVLVWLSVAPSPPDLGLDVSDKVKHFLAYAALMFWFSALYRSARTRLAYGAGWVALGIALELAQGAGGVRSLELGDMAANALGVLAGAAAALNLPRAARARGTETP